MASMGKTPKKKKFSRRGTFPFYLKPHPENKNLCEWIGSFLKEFRGKTSLKDLAEKAGTTTEMLTKIEAGRFELCLGAFRQVLSNGYQCSLEDVLSACHDKHEPTLNKDDRPFHRDWHYRLCFSREEHSEPTPFLMGGIPKSFLWAVPFRQLRRQSLSTELIELAPVKKFHGFTDSKAHDGVEIIHVIHGSICVFIKPGKEAEYNKTISRTDSIHFHSGSRHFVKNLKTQDSALMLVIRTSATIPAIQVKTH
jgi:quercetin dioxygenase-like cupin family protein